MNLLTTPLTGKTWYVTSFSNSRTPKSNWLSHFAQLSSTRPLSSSLSLLMHGGTVLRRPALSQTSTSHTLLRSMACLERFTSRLRLVLYGAYIFKLPEVQRGHVQRQRQRLKFNTMHALRSHLQNLHQTASIGTERNVSVPRDDVMWSNFQSSELNSTEITAPHDKMITLIFQGFIAGKCRSKHRSSQNK